jgi:hypothetical protein
MLDTLGTIAIIIGVIGGIYLMALSGFHQFGAFRPNGRAAFVGAAVLTAIFFIVAFWQAIWGRDAGFAFIVIIVVGLLSFAFWNGKRKGSD